MALLPLSWLLRLTALCHLIVLLAGEWGGLRHERGWGAPSPTSAPQGSMRAPGPCPRKAEIHGSPFLTDMPEGAGHLPGGGPGLRTAPPAGKIYRLQRLSLPGPVSKVATAWQHREVVRAAQDAGCGGVPGGGAVGSPRMLLVGPGVGALADCGLVSMPGVNM